MAIRRTSWIDQRINDSVALLWFLLWFGVSFLGGGELARWRITATWRRRASPGKRGDATHARICSRCDQARTRFLLKTIFDRPPMAFDRHQRFDRRSRWTPGGEEGEIAIGDMTADQTTSPPQNC